MEIDVRNEDEYSDPKLPVLLQTPTTHLPYILQSFWHTLSHLRIHSSQEQTLHCYSRNDVRSQFIRCSAIIWSWIWKWLILRTLKIHGKLMKLAITVIFRNGDKEKKDVWVCGILIENKKKKEEKYFETNGRPPASVRNVIILWWFTCCENVIWHSGVLYYLS